MTSRKGAGRSEAALKRPGRIGFRMQPTDRIAKAIIVMTAAVVLSGCVVLSFNPFFTEDTVIDVPVIHGMWVPAFKDIAEWDVVTPWVFLPDMIRVSGREGGSGQIQATYFKIGDSTFLDAYPVHPDRKQMSEFAATLLVPVHTIVQVVVEKGRLKLIPMNYDKLLAAVKNGSVPISWAMHGDLAIFTGATEEWRSLLASGGHAAWFDPADALVFDRYRP